MLQQGRTETEAEAHTVKVFSSIVDKTLINLDVLSRVTQGDKLYKQTDGSLAIQRPWRLLFLQRTIMMVSRWDSHTHIQDLVQQAEFLFQYGDPADRGRIQETLTRAVHGLRSLQKTYEDDALFVSTMEVMIRRIGLRFGVSLNNLV